MTSILLTEAVQLFVDIVVHGHLLVEFGLTRQYLVNFLFLLLDELGSAVLLLVSNQTCIILVLHVFDDAFLGQLELERRDELIVEHVLPVGGCSIVFHQEAQPIIDCIATHIVQHELVLEHFQLGFRYALFIVLAVSMKSLLLSSVRLRGQLLHYFICFQEMTLFDIIFVHLVREVLRLLIELLLHLLVLLCGLILFLNSRVVSLFVTRLLLHLCAGLLVSDEALLEHVLDARLVFGFEHFLGAQLKRHEVDKEEQFVGAHIFSQKHA